jgi:hypothetical protein
VPVAQHVQSEPDGRVDVRVAVRVEHAAAVAALEEDRVRHLEVRGEAGVQHFRARGGDFPAARRPCDELRPRAIEAWCVSHRGTRS